MYSHQSEELTSPLFLVLLLQVSLVNMWGLLGGVTGSTPTGETLIILTLSLLFLTTGGRVERKAASIFGLERRDTEGEADSRLRWKKSSH